MERLKRRSHIRQVNGTDEPLLQEKMPRSDSLTQYTRTNPRRSARLAQKPHQVSSELQHGRRETEYDDMASLARTESDDGTGYSSEDSYSSPNRTSDKKQQLYKKQKIRTNKVTSSEANARPATQCGIGKYMASRQMTPFQEHLNAWSMLPSTYYCITYFLHGSWLSESFVETFADGMIDDNEFDNSQCINWSWMPHLHALPPLPTLVGAIGILCHGPFSMLYHWNCAHNLPTGLSRVTHWSRRLDQSMLHLCCACITYATSGRLDYFLANVLFNMDCFYRQFLTEVRPRRNQIRLVISIFLYTLPLVIRGEVAAYLTLIILFAIGGWLFGQYPIGGWSHSVFHVAMTFVPPIIFATSLTLSSSQRQLEVAARCTILANEKLVP